MIFYGLPLEDPLHELREMIKLRRLELGLSIEEIAIELEARSTDIENFENGSSSIESSLLFGLINILNLSPDEVEPLIGKAELEIRIKAALAQAPDQVVIKRLNKPSK